MHEHLHKIQFKTITAHYTSTVPYLPTYVVIAAYSSCPDLMSNLENLNPENHRLEKIETSAGKISKFLRLYQILIKKDTKLIY